MYTPENIFTIEPIAESINIIDSSKKYESLGYTKTEDLNSKDSFCKEWADRSQTFRLKNEIPSDITITTLEKNGLKYIAFEVSPSLTIIFENKIRTSSKFPNISTEISHVLYGDQDTTFDILSLLKSDNINKPLLTFYGVGQFDPNTSTPTAPLTGEINRSSNFVHRLLHELAHQSLSPRHHSYAGITELTTAQKEREVNAFVLQTIRKFSQQQPKSPLDAREYDKWAQQQLENYDYNQINEKEYQASRKVRILNN